MSDPVAAMITEARTWLKTPFVHQGRTKGRACDCLGLMIGCAKAIGYCPDGYDERRYGFWPNSQNMGRGIAEYCDMLPARQLQPGDWLWLRFGAREPTHLALFTHDGTVIHAQPSSGTRTSCVVEHHIDARFLALARWLFRFRGLGDG